jgi:aryl-alcohol dehydrogenase-like predicted oxidoreductase
MGYGTPEWQGWVLDEEASLPLLEYAYKIGIRTWDTADAYASSPFFRKPCLLSTLSLLLFHQSL